MIRPHNLGSSTASSEFAIVNRLAKLAGIVNLSDKAVLDIGCNDGAYSVELAKSAERVVAVDVEAERLNSAKRRVNDQTRSIHMSVMNAELLALDDGIFDVVFMNEVLEHIPGQDRALDEIHRVLDADGVLVLFVPNRYYLVETHGARVRDRGMVHQACDSQRGYLKSVCWL